jgi:hypothetical protein
MLANVVEGVKFRDGIAVKSEVHVNRKYQPSTVAA